ncbi:TY-Chap domain-containing protein [Dactylosporangium sp. CS-033363]|uniref:TY-Chap domain-containing protein n=1 Tax=Dactylosporangium sp. CS-033363 TaxID=3239935 RepID=UPI003D93B079
MGTLDDAIDWDTFARGLALDFGQCAFDDAVILRFGADRYVQYIQNLESITVEVSDLDAAALTAGEHEYLAGEGFAPPDDGWTWKRDIPWQPEPQLFHRIAHLVASLLRNLHGVRFPGQLTVESFNVRGQGDFELPFTGLARERAVLNGEMRQADLRLHEAAANLLLQTTVPGARIVAVIPTAADRRSTEDGYGDFFVDRVVLVEGEDPHILLWHHIGPNGFTGSRYVPAHPPADGPLLRAEQGAALYVRDLLQRNRILAEALRADPDLHARMHAVVATGHPDAVRAQRVRVDAEGQITTTRLRMQADELDVPTLKVSAE